MSRLASLLAAFSACAHVAAHPTAYTASAIALPGASPDGVGMDYLLYNPRTQSVWVPAGNTGSVDVIDARTGVVHRITGFATQEMERHGTRRLVGPSSAALGDGAVYIGNRGDSSICRVDDTTLTIGACRTLDARPDGLAYAASTHEVWVTTPGDKSIRVLDGATLAETAKIPLAGEPEGFAVDPVRGRFYTNFEERDQTVAIDLASHAVVDTSPSHCGADGAKGLRVDAARGWLFAACGGHAVVVDLAHGHAVLGSVEIGDGLDDLDYAPATRTLYAGASKAGVLGVVAVDEHGAMMKLASVPTAEGARNGVVDGAGKIYLSHGKTSEILVVTPT